MRTYDGHGVFVGLYFAIRSGWFSNRVVVRSGMVVLADINHWCCLGLRTHLGSKRSVCIMCFYHLLVKKLFLISARLNLEKKGIIRVNSSCVAIHCNIFTILLLLTLL